MKLLEGVEVLALDALRPGPRHSTHFIVSEAIDCSKQIGARETWLIHLAHEVEHFEVQATLPEGVRLAYDGLVLEL
jgi:phosphoribosyl 1,2-cyclic phosphate phosphodiesterase